ncbi:SGNH hydrolase domain-containing protein [Chromobacterium vaccinii]|uniref:SGNH hydrolase domain-containing protein n=1 Tax=Chromobacterium vaccinii TaxID=1108595 RepID=UPI0036F21B80
MFGPTPDWMPDIRHILMKSALKTGRFTDFMEPPFATWGATKNEAERLRKIAVELGIGYVSPLDIFCRGDKCRVKVSDEIPEGLIASDHDHMTAKASIFFFKDVRASHIFGK